MRVQIRLYDDDGGLLFESMSEPKIPTTRVIDRMREMVDGIVTSWALQSVSALKPFDPGRAMEP